MAEKRAISTYMTRYDKAHKKFMDKLNVLKDNVNHGYDSLKAVHKQTIDSSVSFQETVDKGQEVERKALYDIISKSENETRIKEAYGRLAELDRIKEQVINEHNEFLKDEREKTDKNIVGGMILIAVSAGLISNKQVRQMSGKVISSVGKSLLRLKE
nr:hypothetical protein [uncultured Marvinbryantia sp.]